MEFKRFLIIDNLNKSPIGGPLENLAKKYACVLYKADNFEDPALPTVRERAESDEWRHTSHDRCHLPRSRTSNHPYDRSPSDMSDADDQETYHPPRHQRVHKTSLIDSSTDSQTSSTHNSVPQTPSPDLTLHRPVFEALYEVFKVNQSSGITSPNAHQSELLMSLKTCIEQILASPQTQDDRNVESLVKPEVEIQPPNESSAAILNNGADCSRSEQTVTVEEMVTYNSTQNATQEEKLEEPMHHVVVQSSADSKEELMDTTEDRHSDCTSNQEKSEFGEETTDDALNESQVQECMDVTEPQTTVAPEGVIEIATVQMETDDTTLASSCSELNVNADVENVSEQSAIDEEELNHVSSSSGEDSEVKQPDDFSTQVTKPFVDINIAQTMASLPQQTESPEKNYEEVISQVNANTETRAESSSAPIGVTPPTPTVLIPGVTPALKELQIGQTLFQDTQTRNNLQFVSWNRAAPGLPELNASLLQKQNNQVAQPNVPESLNHPNTTTLPAPNFYLKDTPHGKVLFNENNVRLGLYPVPLPSRTDPSPLHPVIPLPAPNPSPPRIFSQIPIIPRNQPILRQEGQIQFPQNLVHQPTLNQFLQHQQNVIHAQLMMHHKPMIAQHPPNMMNWNLMEPVRAPTQSVNAYLSNPILQRVGGQNPNQIPPSPVLTVPSQPFGSEVNPNTALVHQKIRARILKTSDNDPSKESGYQLPTGSTVAPQHEFPATGTIPTVIPTDTQSPTGNAAMETRTKKQPEIEFRPVVQMINVGASISDQELIASQNEAIRNNLPACPPGLYQLGRPLSKNGLVRFYRKDSLERGVELSLPTQPDSERTYRELFTDGRVFLSNLNHQPGWKIGVKGFDPSIREKMKQPNAQTVPTMHPKLQHHGVQNVHPRRRQNETVQMVQQDDNEEHKAKVARLKQNMRPITENRVAAFNTPRPFQGEIVERRQVVAAPSDEAAIQKKKKIAPFTSISDYQDRKNAQSAQVEFIDLTGDEEGETTVGMESSIQNIYISSDRQNHVGKVVLETAEQRQLQQNVSDQEDKPRAEQPEPFNQPNPTKHFFPPDYKKHEANKAPRARILKIAPSNPYPLIAPVRRTKQKHTNFQLTRLKEVYEMYKNNQVSEYDYAKLGHPINLAAFQVKQYINNQKAADRRKQRKAQKVDESKNSYGFNDDNQQ